MQIVIDVPEKDVPNSQEIMTINLHFIAGEVCECSYPYMVLPKGHGRIGDFDALIKQMDARIKTWRDNDAMWYAAVVETAINEVAQVLIEADGGGAE